MYGSTTWAQWITEGWALYTALHPVALTLVTAWVFWMLYVYTMGLYRAKLSGRLKGLPLLLAAPAVVLAFCLDFVFQVTVFTLVFLDPPRELLVTGRLRRYLRELPATHWRRRWADYFCHHLLDPYDPTGGHCDSDPATQKGPAYAA